MSERGTYGRRVNIGQVVGAAQEQSGTSIGKIVVGTLVVGGAILWLKHQSEQIEKLSAKADVPYESFTESLREDVKAIPAAAKEGYQALKDRLSAAKQRVRPAKALPAHTDEGDE